MTANDVDSLIEQLGNDCKALVAKVYRDRRWIVTAFRDRGQLTWCIGSAGNPAVLYGTDLVGLCQTALK
jgi:hypothetical protein